MTRDEHEIRMRLRRYGQSPVGLDAEEEAPVRIRPRRLRIARGEPRPLEAVRRLANQARRYSMSSYRKARPRFRAGLEARLQRVALNVTYTRNNPSRSWAAHGSYLAREGATRPDEKGFGFDAERDEIELRQLLKDWQSAGDELLFKLVVSPEHGAEMDLVAHTRELLAHMERDLGTQLQWAGIVHTNTGKPHAHVVIRGLDEEGQTLTIDRTYISFGMRQRSRELATRELGYRTTLELESARALAVQRNALTELDRAILSRADSEGRVSYGGLSGALAHPHELQEMRRLKFLERLGLAKEIAAGSWKLSPHTQQMLMEAGRAGDIARTLANHRVVLSHPNAQIVFTRIEQENQRLVGRVVGTGLEPGPKGGPYLLLEGREGLGHFVPLPHRLEGFQAEAQVLINSIVTLRGRTSVRAPDDPILHVDLHIEGRYSELGRAATPLALDLEIVERVEREGRPPRPAVEERGFARKWSDALQLRASELEQSRVIERGEAGGFRLIENWRERLDELRFSEKSCERELCSLTPANAAGPYAFLSQVVSRGVDRVLLQNPQGELREIRLADIGHKQAPDQGAELLIRSSSRLGPGDDPVRDQEAPVRETGCRAVADRLSALALHEDRNTYGPPDRILALVGEISGGRRGGPALELLRERQEMWRGRGIAPGESFEQRAREWIGRHEEKQLELALERAGFESSKAIRLAAPVVGLEHRGQVLGFAEHEGSRFILIDTGREVRALRNEGSQVYVGEDVRARYQEIGGTSGQGRRVVWRIQNLEPLRELERERTR